MLLLGLELGFYFASSSLSKRPIKCQFGLTGMNWGLNSQNKIGVQAQIKAKFNLLRNPLLSVLALKP